MKRRTILFFVLICVFLVSSEAWATLERAGPPKSDPGASMHNVPEPGVKAPGIGTDRWWDGAFEDASDGKTAESADELGYTDSDYRDMYGEYLEEPIYPKLSYEEWLRVKKLFEERNREKAKRAKEKEAKKEKEKKEKEWEETPTDEGTEENPFFPPYDGGGLVDTSTPTRHTPWPAPALPPSYEDNIN